MKHRVWVIAGNVFQFNDYVKSKPLNEDKKYAYVSDVNSLRGFSNPHGVFIGTWKSRNDILAIIDQLIISTSGDTSALQKIQKDLITPKRTPLIVHVNGVMQQENTDYTVTTDAIVFTKPPANDTQISLKTLTDLDVYLGDGHTFKFYLKKHHKIQPYEHAADMLAKAIDQEVLDQLIGKPKVVQTVFDIMEEYDQPMTWKGFVK